ncbi:MAG: rhodanese-like domain-containing protein [Methylococcales bacterium]|nr:rhodanese-like domain-containing protein [Methylococcales bacterium]
MNTTYRITCLLTTLLLPLYASNSQADHFTRLTAEQLTQLENHAQPLLVDIRLPSEWQDTGLLPGSVGLTFFDQQGRYDLNAFKQRLAALRTHPDQAVVLLCRSGRRSAKAVSLLQADRPSDHWYDLEGGLMSLNASSLPGLAHD